MRGVLVGLILLPVLAISILSIRPGGLRRQLRAAARRLRVALILAGVYLAISTAIRVIWGDNRTADEAEAAIAAVLAITFVVLSYDREPLPPPG